MTWLTIAQTTKIDFTSPQFAALPEATQYQMLSTARLRSRLRMGYTKDQLEELFPDRLEFSRFQINRVTQRNFFTQKLMNMVGMEGDGTLGASTGTGTTRSRRVAGDKGNEYMLQKNQSGWTLALEGNKDGVVTIDVDDTEMRQDKRSKQAEEEEEESEEEDWEDVPLVQAKEEQKEELPESLQGFSDQILRQQLYDRLKTQISTDDESLYDKPVLTTKAKAKPKDSFFVIDEDEPSAVSTNDESHKGVASLSSTTSFIEDDEIGFGPSIFSKKKDTSESAANATDKEKAPGGGQSQNKKVEVLPPWFIKQSQSGGIEQNSTVLNPTDDDELITVEQLDHDRGVVQFYESDDDDDVELTSMPVLKRDQQNFEVIKDSNSDSDLEEVIVHSETFKEKSKQEEGNLKGVDLDKDRPVESQFVASSPEIDAKTDASLEDTVPQITEKSASNEKLTASPDITISEQENQSLKDTNHELQASVITDEQNQAADPVAPKYTTEHEAELADADMKFALEEDEELLELLEKEEEENRRFTAELSSSSSVKPPHVHLKTVEAYDSEIVQLKNQAKKEQRDSDEVTQAMIEECQELLRRFGIPYITAPMEAEAQCATLQELGLVEGIVTDDSDCFLFGGRRIFKNMFTSANKYVECYDVADLEREFGLDRNKMVRLALLLGSDYTDGVTGVGPVTAMEILAEFDNGGLEAFRDWWERVQLKLKPIEGKEEEDEKSAFRSKFKKNARKIFLPSNFPDEEVVAAYKNPEVDDDNTEFEWGVPDLDSIRGFMRELVGWPEERTEEVLVPVVKSLNGRVRELKQKGIGDYFLFSKPGGESGGAAAPGSGVGKSTRLTKALERMGQKQKQKQKQSSKRKLADDEVEDGVEVDVDGLETLDAVCKPGESFGEPVRKKAKSKAKAKAKTGTKVQGTAGEKSRTVGVRQKK